MFIDAKRKFQIKDLCSPWTKTTYINVCLKFASFLTQSVVKH
jgi:hypothetical protein